MDCYSRNQWIQSETRNTKGQMFGVANGYSKPFGKCHSDLDAREDGRACACDCVSTTVAVPFSNVAFGLTHVAQNEHG